MSTTVTYKGQTLTTVNNQTKTLETAGTFLEDDITLTDVTAAGATNVVTGTFTTPSTTGVQTVTLPYTGSGYPVEASVWVQGGISEPSTAWYSTVHRYAVGLWQFAKANSTTPTFTASGANNQGPCRAMYKSSATTSTSLSSSASGAVIILTSTNPTTTATACVRFKSSTRLAYIVADTSYGLLPNTTYQYSVVYSS